jgi:hypothetical protein
MTSSLAAKAACLAAAAMVTLSLMTSLDALARTEQSSALATANGVTQTACVAPALRS